MDKNPTTPESTCALVVRAIGIICTVVLGMSIVLLASGCTGIMKQGSPVFVSVTAPTEANPDPQLAVEWPASVTHPAEIATIKVGDGVISYAPITAEEAEAIKRQLGQ